MSTWTCFNCGHKHFYAYEKCDGCGHGIHEPIGQPSYEDLEYELTSLRARVEELERERDAHKRHAEAWERSVREGHADVLEVAMKAHPYIIRDAQRAAYERCYRLCADVAANRALKSLSTDVTYEQAHVDMATEIQAAIKQEMEKGGAE